MPATRAEQPEANPSTDPSASIPTQGRTEPDGVGKSDHAAIAHLGLTAVRTVTATLLDVVSGMSQPEASQPSRLPGWSRGHVISHLARNADALVNLLTWARTGVEHPMYASAADRDADIEEGSHRMLQIQQEDVRAASERFFQAAVSMADVDWQATVAHRTGRQLAVSSVPWMRLIEVVVHLADLDLEVDFDEAVTLAGPQSGDLLDHVIGVYTTKPDTPPVHLTVTLPTNEQRTWTLGTGDHHAIHGPAGPALAWLTGRDLVGTGLTGHIPTLPAWL